MYVGSNPTLSACHINTHYLLHISNEMIIKKCFPLKGRSLRDILFKIGFKKKEGELRILYFRNRKGISKIGIYVAKKNIKGSVTRNLLRRVIKNAYKILTNNNYFIYNNIIMIISWSRKIIPSPRKINMILNIIFNTFLTQISPNLRFYIP